jgi:hypothetical protein
LIRGLGTPAFKIGEKTNGPLAMYLVDVLPATENNPASTKPPGSAVSPHSGPLLCCSDRSTAVFGVSPNTSFPTRFWNKCSAFDPNNIQ